MYRCKRNLTRTVERWVKDQLVDENLEERMAAVAQRADLAAIRWQRKTPRGDLYWLRTPYGDLKIWRSFRGCWSVQRDDVRLVHDRSPREALFTSLPAAKVAGLVHLMDGFADKAPLNDGLWWNSQPSTPRSPVLQPLADFQVDPSIPDDHEWGLRQLESLLKSIPTAVAADRILVLDVERAAGCWQLPPPKWTKRAHGYYELNTPYGLLVVRRLIGWTVERSGVPLVWFWGGEKVIFDKLEHAKTSALVHAREYGSNYVGDGTRWDKTADDVLAESGTPDQCDANKENDRVVA
jgi:hypothetical protein